MDDDGDNIQLNLTTTSSFKPQKRNNKPKVSSTSIKEKKHVEITRGLLNATKIKRPHSSNEKPHSKKSYANKKPKLSSEDRPWDHTIISSLFNNNPEIPSAPRLSHDGQVTEELFVSESFDKLPLHPFIVGNLKTNFDITSMTYVQKASIPHLLGKKDALIKSQTGSGKTLAYALPMVHSLQEIEPKIERKNGVYALVVLPTRELAIQSYDTFDKLCKAFTRIVPGYLIGGEKKKSEKARLRKGINILVATPGRLIDHLDSTKSLTLNKVRWLIIDEADRLMDFGYEKDLTTIVSRLNEQVEDHLQTVMLSATLSPGIEKLAGLALKKPQIIDAASHHAPTIGRLVIPASLEHFYMMIPLKLKLVTLATFITMKSKFNDEGKIIVFFSTQDMVDYHARLLHQLLNKPSINEDTEDIENDLSDSDDSVHVFKLHGNMTQQDRTQVFRHFKEANSGVLLSTDVAARGLDLPDVDWIVQYTAPSRPQDYVHRVGRTSRIGHVGHAVLFLLPSEVGYVKLLAENNIRLQEMPMNDILNSLATPSASSRNTKKKKKPLTFEEAATQLQLSFENAVLSNDDLKNQARKAFQSYVRAYSTYPVGVRKIFNFKELHLGHLAKSLALRETPSELGAVKPKITKSPKIQKRIGRERIFKTPRIDLLSEFASGL